MELIDKSRDKKTEVLDERKDDGELDEDRNRESEQSDEQMGEGKLDENVGIRELLIIHQFGRHYHHQLCVTSLNEKHKNQLVTQTSLNKY